MADILIATRPWVQEQDYATNSTVTAGLALKWDIAQHNTFATEVENTYATKEELAKASEKIFRFKGSVATEADLPTKDNVVGDVYNVEDTGANYCWYTYKDEDEKEVGAWDKLSETVDLSPYALKAEYVSLAGVQTITGAKTFTSQVTIPATPVADTDAASKGYVDSEIADAVAPLAVDDTVVHNTGAETIAGAKTFSSKAVFSLGATVPATPTENTDAASKKYVDDAIGEIETTLSDDFVNVAEAQTITGAKTFTAQVTIPETPTADASAASKKYVDGAVAPKAEDDEVVHLAEAETITGVKTFSAKQVFSAGATVPETPTADSDAASKKYVDGAVAPKAEDDEVVHLTGNETIAGVKTFTSNVTIPATPTANTDAASKKYVDDSVAPKAENDEVVHLTGAESVDGVKTFAAKAVFSAGATVPETPTADADAASKKYVDGAVDPLAVDEEVVHLTGNETIAGVKTFTSNVTIPATPTANTDAASKKYVDDSVAPKAEDDEVVHLTGAETVGGVKTFTDGAVFSAAVTIPVTPTANTDAASKKYVDDAVDPLAVDTTVVHLAGEETVTGAKTFSAKAAFTAGATVPATPTADTDAASKGYVDTEVEAAETAASTADTNILTGVTAFSKIRLRDENDEDWYLTVDAANETLVIAKITA